MLENNSQSFCETTQNMSVQSIDYIDYIAEREEIRNKRFKRNEENDEVLHTKCNDFTSMCNLTFYSLLSERFILFCTMLYLAPT